MYNEGENVRRTLDSVLFRADGRPERGLELVCVDDGSTDDTREAHSNLRSRGHTRLRLAGHSVNRGRGMP